MATGQRASVIRGIHHLNFLVRDLDEAVRRYEHLLGLRVERHDELPDRGVRIARFRVGATWILLVQPVADGEPQRHLDAHGEGFFLVSYAVDDVRDAAARVRAAGGRTASEVPRAGLDGWQVIDIASEETCGAIVQLCQDDSRYAPA